MPSSNGRVCSATSCMSFSIVKLMQTVYNCRSQNGQDEGRDAFKSLKNQQIADKSALLYLQWADLELKSGMHRPTHVLHRHSILISSSLSAAVRHAMCMH